ncbi:hypothetical protein INR49_000372 [Caranx melampygus]|nr:hypothetical protein INR49_000372 [Caranx melampygus]
METERDESYKKQDVYERAGLPGLRETPSVSILDKFQLLLDLLAEPDELVPLHFFFEVIQRYEPKTDAVQQFWQVLNPVRQEHGLEEGAASCQNQAVAWELLVLDFEDTVHKLVILQQVAESILKEGLLVHPRLLRRLVCCTAGQLQCYVI